MNVDILNVLINIVLGCFAVFAMLFVVIIMVVSEGYSHSSKYENKEGENENGKRNDK